MAKFIIFGRAGRIFPGRGLFSAYSPVTLLRAALRSGACGTADAPYASFAQTARGVLPQAAAGLDPDRVGASRYFLLAQKVSQKRLRSIGAAPLCASTLAPPSADAAFAHNVLRF